MPWSMLSGSYTIYVMSNLSPAYREDSVAPIDPAVQDYLDREYVGRQRNIDVNYPHKIIILFAGGSAVGKSSLAKALQEEFKGVIIENDGIKRALRAYNGSKLPDDLNLITWNYTIGLYQRLDRLTKNGFVIRDGMIHWYYDRLLPVFKKAGYKTIVIQYDISPEKNAQLIDQRGDTPTTTAARLRSLIVEQEIHMKRFLQAYQPDIVIDETTLYDYDQVIQKIKSLIARM